MSRAEGLLTPCVLHAGPRSMHIQRKLSITSRASTTFKICLMHKWQSYNVLLLLPLSSCLRERIRSLEHCHGCGARGKRLPSQQGPEVMLPLRERRKKLPVKQMWLDLPAVFYFHLIPVWFKFWSMRIIISFKNLFIIHFCKSGWCEFSDLWRLWHVSPTLLKSNVNLKWNLEEYHRCWYSVHQALLIWVKTRNEGHAVWLLDPSASGGSVIVSHQFILWPRDVSKWPVYCVF